MVERLRVFMGRPEVRALSDADRLRLAHKELGLSSMSCPNCESRGCDSCSYEGVVFVLRDEN